MRIGTDASMSICKTDGYMIMDYKVRELMPKGVLNPDCSVRFIKHIPDYIKEEINWCIGMPAFTTDATVSANDVWELYLSHKEGIDSMCGFEGDREFPKDPYDLLSIADEVDSYCGLNL